MLTFHRYRSSVVSCSVCTLVTIMIENELIDRDAVDLFKDALNIFYSLYRPAN